MGEQAAKVPTNKNKRYFLQYILHLELSCHDKREDNFIEPWSEISRLNNVFVIQC